MLNELKDEAILEHLISVREHIVEQKDICLFEIMHVVSDVSVDEAGLVAPLGLLHNTPLRLLQCENVQIATHRVEFPRHGLHHNVVVRFLAQRTHLLVLLDTHFITELIMIVTVVAVEHFEFVLIGGVDHAYFLRLGAQLVHIAEVLAVELYWTLALGAACMQRSHMRLAKVERVRLDAKAHERRILEVEFHSCVEEVELSGAGDDLHAALRSIAELNHQLVASHFAELLEEHIN